MKKTISIMSFIFIFIVLLTQPALADLDGFLSDLNKRARTDINNFNSILSSQFKIPLPDIKAINKTVKDPADVFMCFQLSKMTGIHVEKVVKVYKKKRKKGWGAIAKELGIKPGSSAFHALKKGDFVFDSQHKVKKKKSKSKGKGKKDKKKK